MNEKRVCLFKRNEISEGEVERRGGGAGGGAGGEAKEEREGEEPGSRRRAGQNQCSQQTGNIHESKNKQINQTNRERKEKERISWQSMFANSRFNDSTCK